MKFIDQNISFSIYIINRTLHGRLGIRILSSRAESISHSFVALIRARFSALEDKNRIPVRPFNILYFHWKIQLILITQCFIGCRALFTL